MLLALLFLFVLILTVVLGLTIIRLKATVNDSPSLNDTTLLLGCTEQIYIRKLNSDFEKAVEAAAQRHPGNKAIASKFLENDCRMFIAWVRKCSPKGQIQNYEKAIEAMKHWCWPGNAFKIQDTIVYD